MGTGIAVCPSSLCERLALPGCGRYRTCELQSVPLLFYSDIFIPWLENDNLHHWAIPDFCRFYCISGQGRWFRYGRRTEFQIFQSGNLRDVRIHDRGGEEAGSEGGEGCERNKWNYSGNRPCEREYFKPSTGIQAEPEYCGVRIPGFHEVQGLCPEYDSPVYPAGREYVHYGS